jgi:radical SAM superfamily enzyme YgiQ (UPF0313 family)
MRILFSPSYQLELDPKQARNREPYPPLGTLYAASRLRRDGHEVALSDSILASGLSEYRDDLARFRPDLVALFEDNFNYLSKMCLTNMRDAGFEKARLAKAAGASVVVNGSDATDHLEDYLRAPIDFAILGEGEETLSELASALARAESGTPGPNLRGMKGLAFLDERGYLVKNESRGFIRALDALPFPAWDLVDVERYRRAWRERHDFFSVNMVTTRGCPYHCNWCAKPIYGQRYNLRSPGNVASELAWLRETVRPDHVWFADDIFGLKPGWVEEFASEVEARGIRTPFKIQARADLIDDSVARALGRAGCENVWLGAESGSQKILDAMDKGIRVAQIEDAARSLRAQGIRVALFLQFGYPGEEWSDIEKTVAMVRRVRPDDIGISVSYPLPGTPFFERVRAELGDKTNWADSDDLDLMFRGSYHPAFYRALYRLVHSDFRLRRELRRLPRPASAARALKNAAGWIAARVEVESLARRRNPALGFPIS